MTVQPCSDTGPHGVAMLTPVIRELPHRLQRLFIYHATACPMYREVLAQARVNLNSIRTYTDWLRVPTLSKRHVMANPPWGFVSGDRSLVARFLETSGSTGVPKVLPVSQAESRKWNELTRRFLLLAGFTSDAVTMTIFPQGPWPSGYLISHGADHIGPTYTADVIMPDEWYVAKMALYKPRHIVTLPSFMTRLTRIAQQGGIDIASIKSIVVGGEHLFPRQRAHIEQVFTCARVVEGYGSAEVGVCATECKRRHGLHFFEDEYFIEVLDPDGDDPVADGEIGELVISPMFRKTAPVLRYRTGDLIKRIASTSSCEIGGPLYSYILSRCDDVLVMGSCKVFPDDIEHAIREHATLSDSHFTLHLETDPVTLLPRLRLLCERLPNTVPPQGIQQALAASLRKYSHAFSYGIGTGLATSPVIEVVEPGTLYRDQLKHRRFVDRRARQDHEKIR